MDISSLFLTSIPSYFVLGPLVIIVITLVVLAARKASPVMPQVSVPITSVPVPASTFVTETPVLMTQVPVAPLTPSVVEASVQPISISTPPQPAPVVEVKEAPVIHVEQATLESIPETIPTPQLVAEVPDIQTSEVVAVVEAPAPALVPVAPLTIPEAEVVVAPPSAPIPTPVSVPTGVIPPISSWKPAEPVAVPVEIVETQSQVSTTQEVKSS
jgi:hypothetical protein